MTVYKVNGPVAVLSVKEGGERYLYGNAVFPGDGFTEASVAHLLEVGVISEVEDAVEVPEGDPSDAWTVKQLDAYASREGVDVAGASNKAEKLALLTK